MLYNVLVRHCPHGPPPVETSGEPLALFTLDSQEKSPRLLWLLGSQVLDVYLANSILENTCKLYIVYLSRLVSQFNFHL